jgi:thiol-disulfide isomerase/thioredoxin
MRSRINVPTVTAIALCILVCVPAVSSQFVVKGRVVGWNGKPLPLAHVSDNPEGRNARATDENGYFRITLSKKEPRYLSVSGVGCYGNSIPLLTDLEDSVELIARLDPVRVEEISSEADVRYRTEQGSAFKQVRMTKEADGTYRAAIYSQKRQIEFQILNMAKNNWPVVLGTNADSFVSDGRLGYFAVKSCANDTAMIQFDPAAVPIASQQSFEFTGKPSTTARFSRLHGDLTGMYMRFVDSLQALQRESRATESCLRAWTDSASMLKRAIVAEDDQVLKGELLIRYYRLTSINGMVLDTSFVRTLITGIPFSSPLWVFNNYEAFDMSKIHPLGDAFVDSMLECNPSRELRAFLLFSRAQEAQYMMDEKAVRLNYERLKDEFGDVFWARIADTQIAVRMKVKRGVQIPDFAFKGLDDSTIVYSKGSMKGKVYLLDFWATWCLPCIGEIPFIKKAYEKFRSKGLRIISVSLDAQRESPLKFRKLNMSMPWEHAWVHPEDAKALHDTFEITGIPKPILVDGDGMIVGLKSEVRGENLEKTLGRLMGE